MAAWRAWLQGFLLRELSEVSRALGPLTCEPLPRAVRHLARMLQAFQDRLNARVQNALGQMLGQTQSSEPRPRRAAEEFTVMRNALLAGPGQSHHAPEHGLP